MPTIKNVGRRVDDLHDGRPIERLGVATVSAADLELEHYQTRIADGRFLVVEPAKPRARRIAAAKADTQESDR